MSSASQGLALLVASMAVGGSAWLGWTRSLPPTLQPTPTEEAAPVPILPPPIAAPPPDAREGKQRGDKKGERSGTEGEGERNSSVREGLGRAFMQLDVDGDGRVSMGEYSEDGRWASRFLDRDADGDNFVTREELKATRIKQGEGEVARWKDFPIPAADANGDGGLDKSEFPGPPEVFLLLDSDTNGLIVEAEVAKL